MMSSFGKFFLIVIAKVLASVNNSQLDKFETHIETPKKVYFILYEIILKMILVDINSKTLYNL